MRNNLVRLAKLPRQTTSSLINEGDGGHDYGNVVELPRRNQRVNNEALTEGSRRAQDYRLAVHQGVVCDCLILMENNVLNTNRAVCLVFQDLRRPKRFQR